MASEELAQGARRGIAAREVYLLERGVRTRREVAGPAEACGVQLVLDGVSGELAEPLLGRAASGLHIPRHVVNSDSVADAETDELDRLEGRVVGVLVAAYARPRHELAVSEREDLRLQARIREKPVEQLRGHLARAGELRDDRREGRTHVLANELVVVNSDDGDVLRDLHAVHPRRAEDELAGLVVRGEDARGLLERAEPRAERGIVVLRRRSPVRRGLEHAVAPARLGHHAHEGVLALLGPVAHRRFADEAV